MGNLWNKPDAEDDAFNDIHNSEATNRMKRKVLYGDQPDEGAYKRQKLTELEAYSGRNRFRILTFNVQGYQTANSRQKRDTLLAILDRSNADIIGLQEDTQPRPSGIQFGRYHEITACKGERLSKGNSMNPFCRATR